MRKLFFLILYLIVLHVQAQFVFGDDPYIVLQSITKTANKIICEKVKVDTILQVDSVYKAKIISNHANSSLIIYRRNEALLKSVSKKNEFIFEIFQMKISGKVVENRRIMYFNGISKKIQYKVIDNNGIYVLIPKKTLANDTNSKELKELKDNIPSLVNFVRDYMLVPPSLCK